MSDGRTSVSRGYLRFGLASLLLAIGSAARGQYYDPSGSFSPVGNLEGITVVGKGAVAARPNRLEIDLEVSAASELSADAIVKYRDAKKRLQDAFAAMKLAEVGVEERGLLVDQKGQSFNPYFFSDSGPSRKGKIEVQLSRKLVVTCGNIRTMDEEAVLALVAKLLDVAQDAGAQVGPKNDMSRYYYYYGNGNQTTGLVRFLVDDYESLQEKAYDAAIADARTRAGRLARLGAVDLGRVVGVRELVIPAEAMASNVQDEMPRKRLSTSKFQEIPVKVELQVRFGVGDAKPKGANP